MTKRIPRHSRSLRPLAPAGAVLAALVLAPAEAQAEERLHVHVAADVGGIGLFDRGALDQSLSRSGFTTLPKASRLIGARLGFEYRRFYLGSYAFQFQGASKTSGQETIAGTVDFGYRVAGTPIGWGIIPVLGLGVGNTSLRVGSASEATSFSAALRGRTPVELSSKSFIVHAGLLVDILSIHDKKLQTGGTIGLSAGFLAAPWPSKWAAASVGQGGGPGLSGSPHTPGTGLYGAVRVSLMF